MKNTKVIALRIMGFGMLLLGALSLAMGNNEATACMTCALIPIFASNRIIRRNR